MWVRVGHAVVPNAPTLYICAYVREYVHICKICGYAHRKKWRMVNPNVGTLCHMIIVPLVCCICLCVSCIFCSGIQDSQITYITSIFSKVTRLSQFPTCPRNENKMLEKNHTLQRLNNLQKMFSSKFHLLVCFSFFLCPSFHQPVVWIYSCSPGDPDSFTSGCTHTHTLAQIKFEKFKLIFKVGGAVHFWFRV